MLYEEHQLGSERGTVRVAERDEEHTRSDVARDATSRTTRVGFRVGNRHSVVSHHVGFTPALKGEIPSL